MSQTKKAIGIGCTAILGFMGILIVVLLLVVYWNKKRFDEITYPFFDEVMPILTQWDHRAFEPYWAPEVVQSWPEENMIQLFGMYRRLGALQEFAEPQFQNIGTTTQIPYPSHVTYKFHASFENGTALLTWVLVHTPQGSLRVWSLHVHSDVFIVPLESGADSAPQN